MHANFGGRDTIQQFENYVQDRHRCQLLLIVTIVIHCILIYFIIIIYFIFIYLYIDKGMWLESMLDKD